MFESGLDNELMTLDTGLEDSTMEADKPLYGPNSKVGRYRDDVIVGEDGNFYNEDGERVYYWVVPRETDSTMSYTGSETRGIGQDYGGYYTESEIRSAWDADEGMGYLKDQTDWDNYWGFISERQALIQTGDLPDPTTPEYQSDYPATGSDLYPTGPAPTPNVGSSFGGGRDEEIYLAQEAAAGQDASKSAMENWVQLNASLMNKYGIQAEYVNGDGDRFLFNGSTYTRVFKAEGPDWGKMVASIMVSAAAWAVAGPTLVSAFQGAGMSAAVAKGAAAAVLSGASQGITEGEVDLERALIAAVTAYGGSHLSDALAGSGVLGEVGDKITSLGDALVDNGGDVLQAALSAGGISAVTQLVMEGEIDWKSAGIAALSAGGMTALKQFLGGIGKPTDDEFLQELAEQEEWQQAAIDADIKDPFLNPNYKTVGDGLVMNINTNEVFGVTSGDSYGSMGDLDLDGDGALAGNDLQNIDTTNEYVEGGIGTDDPGNPFRFDSQGNLIADGSDYFKEEGRYYVTENGVIYNASDVRYVDGGPNGTILVRDGQGNTFYVTDARYSAASGSFYNPETGRPIGVYGAYDPASGNVYDATTAGIEMTPIVDNTAGTEFSFGRNPNIDDPNYYGTIYGQGVYGTNGITGAEGEFDLYYNRETNTYYTINVNGDVVPIDPEQLPPEVQDIANDAITEAATGPANESTDAGGNSTTNATTSSPGNAGTNGGDAPKPADSYSQTFIQAIADATNQGIDRIIERINNGESPADIFNDPTGGNTAVDPTTGNTTTTPATTTGGGTNTGTQTSGEKGGDPDAEPKEGDPCTTADGRKGVITNGACVYQPTTLGVDPSVWADDSNTTGGTTDSNNSGGDNSGNKTGTTTTDAATPGKPDTGSTPGVLVVADDVWGTGTQGDGNTGSGDGTGDGEGDGDGSGGGGSGGKGAGRIVAGAQGSNTQWSPLFPGTKFRRFDKRARQGMMSQISQPNFSQDSRQNLYAGMFSDLMKGKA